MATPYISIIIPMYNAESTIEKLLDSVIGQTLSNLELILIDDCSSDNSIKVVKKKLENQHINYLLIQNETNQGQSLSRRLGLTKASGDYVSFIDSDDWLDSTMYEEMYETAANNKADIVTCDHYIEFNNQSTIANNKSNDLIEGILTNKVAGSLWNKIFKRDLFDSSIMWPKLNMGEDGAICIQLILRTKTLKHINKPLYHYYINPISTINKKGKEDYLRRSIGLKESSDIIFNILQRHKLTAQYTESILFRKVYINLLSSAVVDDKKIYNQVIGMYPDLSFASVYFSRLPKTIKLRYILFRIRLYPYIYNIIKLIRSLKNEDSI